MRARRVAMFAALSVVLAATLLPGSGPPVPERCLLCSDNAAADILLNVALFIPLGALLVVNGLRPSRAVLCCLLLSTAVESAQLFIPGRDASLMDVVSNCTGSAVGILAARTASSWLAPPPGRAARLAGGAGASAALLLVVTSVLLQSDFPRTRYFGQWTEQFGDMAWYRGRVVSVDLGGRQLPSWDFAASDSVRAALLAGAALHVHAVAGPRTDSLAPIFSISDERQRRILLLGADRGDLVFRYRTRAAAWRLEQPDLRIAGALDAIAPGDRLDLIVERVGPYACLTVNGRRSCPGFSPAVGWAFLAYPTRSTAPLRRAAGILWAVLLLLPLCYWGLMAARRAR